MMGTVLGVFHGYVFRRLINCHTIPQAQLTRQIRVLARHFPLSAPQFL